MFFFFWGVCGVVVFVAFWFDGFWLGFLSVEVGNLVRYVF